MRRALPLLLALVIPLAAGCGDDEESVGSAGSGTQTAATTAEQDAAPAAGPVDGCRKVAEPEPRESGGQRKPSSRLDRGKSWTAVMRTSCGTIEIRLAVRGNPRTTSSFAALARDDFYDDLTFHRIVPGFVVQGGSPDGTPTGDPGYSITEAPPEDTRYTRGVVAMAKTELEDPGTSGSQFFIVVGDQAASLPPDYAVVGRVSEGLDVVDRIAEVPNDPAEDGRPAEPVVIEDVAVREG
jgi:peptidyl-prolyl cis-trans isomerase B (cyclophilin B)